MNFFNKTRNIIIIIIYSLLFWICNIILDNGDLTIYNIVISFCSILLFTYGFDRFCKKINVSNTFLTFFYLGIALNCLSLSGLQKPKELVDIYFYFFGPIVFFLVLKVIEGIKLKKVKIKGIKIKGRFIAYIIFVAYVILRCYTFKKTGIKLLDSNFRMNDNSKYAIEGITGLGNMLMLMSLMLMHEGKRLYKVIVILVIFIFECFFMVSRGQIIKIFAFLLMYFLLNQNYLELIKNKGANIFTRKNIFIIIICSFIIIFAFSQMGQYRQNARSNGMYNILYTTRIKIDSVPLAWLYSYYPLNYEVLRLYYQEPIKPLGYPSTMLLPVVRMVFNDSENYLRMINSKAQLNINGFNASTFLSGYIMDFGYFYFIELIFLGIFIGFLEKLSDNFKGVYAFILSLVLLYSFGEYLMIAYYFTAILVTLFLYGFIIKENEHD